MTLHCLQEVDKTETHASLTDLSAITVLVKNSSWKWCNTSVS